MELDFDVPPKTSGVEVRKRFLTCLAACLMPPEGVDENFESSMDRLRFYTEEAALFDNRAEQSPMITTGTAISGEVKARPGLVLADF
jgi:hypothetical protein